MKPLFCFAALAAAFALSSCDDSLLTVDNPHPMTQGSFTTYSGSFMGGQWITPRRLGMGVTVDNRKTSIQMPLGFPRMTGSGRNEDVQVPGTLTLGIWNFGDQPVDVKILRVTCGEASLLSGRTIHAIPLMHISGGRIASFKIPNLATELPATVDYEIGGVQHSLSLNLKRATTDQVGRYNSRGGFSPGTFPFEGGKLKL